jgi:hypothetical protein
MSNGLSLCHNQMWKSQETLMSPNFFFFLFGKFGVHFLSRCMSKPGKEHWTIVKRVFNYLHGTTSYGLCYQGRPRLERVLDIHGFVDAD